MAGLFFPTNLRQMADHASRNARTDYWQGHDPT